ncbi:hypothetical protein Y032_0110g173 [Ancylostoma ceylanicum]|uniref:Uncharacterized protein n=1 Tax=Ancylostoma ceylanicum TaxID=53326 RepID=A0A016TEL3_9BILA|nr:hypothetical protein Y032_0110g173 [Ancylostoma ceylanicum]
MMLGMVDYPRDNVILGDADGQSWFASLCLYASRRLRWVNLLTSLLTMSELRGVNMLTLGNPNDACGRCSRLVMLS